ncbi:MAG: DUF835 domain-containing protein, partial [Methanomassiliicoccales archaeon]|nr:DUF835 domain-containing protein [Methanomassiliicoccales archaeon]
MALVVLEPGNICIVMGKKADRAFGLYKTFLERGHEVEVYARMHPERLEREFGIPQAGITWLSNVNGPRALNPQSMGVLTDSMVRLYERETSPVVILEGIEYLMAQNDFGKVLKMFDYLFEMVSIRQGLLILPLDPQAFSEKELAYLTREALVVGEADE